MKTVVIQHTQEGKRELLTNHFSRQSFRVLPCETADEAFRLLTKEAPNLMIMAISPLHSDFEEFREAVRYVDPTLPVLYLIHPMDCFAGTIFAWGDAEDYLIDDIFIYDHAERGVSRRAKKLLKKTESLRESEKPPENNR